jgi:hypothetical protein
VTPLRKLLRTIRGTSAQARAWESLAVANKTVRDEARALRSVVAEATRQINAAQLQIEQLTAARAGDEDAGAQIDRLAPLLDRERTAAHIREAVAASEWRTSPEPRATVRGLLPPDLYAALVAAIPADIFFRTTEEGGRELVVPPRIAPLHAIVAWTFLAEVVDDVLVPAVDGRMHGTAPAVGLTTSRPRLVRGHSGRLTRPDPGDRLALVIWFVPGADVGQHGNAADVFVPPAAAAPPPASDDGATPPHYGLEVRVHLAAR